MSIKKIFLIIIHIFIIYETNGTTDYCKFQLCKEPGQHILCLYPNDATSSSCGDVSRTGISEFQQKSLVDAINVYRRQNSANEVRWSNSLEALAQKWANQCTTSQPSNGCNTPDERTNVYQLIYKGSKTEYPYEVISEWEESNILKPSQGSERAALDQVGCARVEASKGNYLVCNFGITWY